MLTLLYCKIKLKLTHLLRRIQQFKNDFCPFKYQINLTLTRLRYLMLIEFQKKIQTTKKTRRFFIYFLNIKT